MRDVRTLGGGVSAVEVGEWRGMGKGKGRGEGEGGMSPVVGVDGGGDKEGGHCYGEASSSSVRS